MLWWDNWIRKVQMWRFLICNIVLGIWIDRVGKNIPWNCNFGFYWSSRKIDDIIIFRCNNFMQQIVCNQLVCNGLLSKSDQLSFNYKEWNGAQELFNLANIWKRMTEHVSLIAPIFSSSNLSEFQLSPFEKRKI